jgi:heat-inducible transcriptional repressor
MNLSERQEQILNALIKEYINTAEPVSSKLLKQRADLDVSEATIRNDFQELTERGMLTQPHTSAGRVPTKKAYKYLARRSSENEGGLDETDEFHNFIVRQIKFAHQEMEREMQTMQELMQSLENDDLFEILNILDKWHKNQWKI